MFSFRPMTRADVPLLSEWIIRPHVAEFWSDPPPPKEIDAWCVEAPKSQREERHDIVLLGGMGPVGFIQTYAPVECHGDGWWLDEHDAGVRGIDVFLADAGNLGKGLGSAMIRAFADFLFEDLRVTKIQCDPEPRNRRAIRCYEKAGFRCARETVTPDGPAILMYRDRPPRTG